MYTLKNFRQCSFQIFSAAFQNEFVAKWKPLGEGIILKCIEIPWCFFFQSQGVHKQSITDNLGLLVCGGCDAGK